MIDHQISGTMLAVKDGYLECPYCRASRLQRIWPETEAKHLQVFCRRCKHEMIVNISGGQCYLSRGQ